MGEAGGGAGVSDTLSLFTNNPYRRKNPADSARAPALSHLESSENGSNKEPFEKRKKLAGKEAEVESIICSAEKKTKKKKKKKEKKGENVNVVESFNGAPGKSQQGALQYVNEGAQAGKKKKSLGTTAVVENALSNAELNESAKELSSAKGGKEKLSKRKVIEEEIQEEFEKKFRGSDGKKAKSERHVSQGAYSEDPEIDCILHESIQEENKKQGKRKVADDDDSVAVPTKKRRKKTEKEVEEEEEKNLRTVFVGNLATTVKKKQIVREFSQFGKVESARLRSVALVDTKLPRKAAIIAGHVNEKRTSQNAYVVFEEAESAKAALVHNMIEFQGKHIRVDMATAPGKDSKPGVDNASEYDRTRSLFIGNLPFDVEEEDLYKVFANDNPELSVEAIRVPRDPQTSIGKGFGFVLFKTKAGANATLAKKSAKLGERYLRVVRVGFQRHKKSSGPTTAQDHGRFNNSRAASRRLTEGVNSAGAKKGPLPWEGARASKSDGKQGKRTSGRHDRRQTSEGAKISGHPAPKVRLTKRPSVLARKNLLQKNAGPNRKADEGRKGGGKLKKAK